ncbi:MAG: patatin-like phospholipase family protein, partial [Acidimicrobiia bacterium]|nr:patatin-like phospholipase family protein [Acidimicrobiia bacterium]
MARPTALVLSGGASLGSTQVGMLRAALESGFSPDLVVGTSVGAFNGAVVACHRERSADVLDAVWRAVDRAAVFPEGVLQRAVLLARTRRHLFSNRALRRLIDDNLPFQKFDELALPLGVVATDVRSGRPVLFTEGPLRPA